MVSLFTLSWWIAICAWRGIFLGNLVVGWSWQHLSCRATLLPGLFCVFSWKSLLHDSTVNWQSCFNAVSNQWTRLTDHSAFPVWPCVIPSHFPQIPACPDTKSYISHYKYLAAGALRHYTETNSVCKNFSHTVTNVRKTSKSNEYAQGFKPLHINVSLQ